MTLEKQGDFILALNLTHETLDKRVVSRYADETSCQRPGDMQTSSHITDETREEITLLAEVGVTSSRKMFVNGAADFPSVLEMHKPPGGHDGWKIRRPIYNEVC